MTRSSRAIVALWLLLSASPAIAAGLPVLFIHGFCSSADTWDETLPQLSTRRYGYDAPRLYENTNGKAAARTLVTASSRTFRIDFSDLAGGFDLLAVANVPTERKAGELKVVIDAIKQFTGAPAVILVGHSLGGLAARSYMVRTLSGSKPRGYVVICQTLLNIKPAPATSTIVNATCSVTIARPLASTRRDADTLRPPSFRTSCTFVKQRVIAGPTPNSKAVPIESAAATAITPKSRVVSVSRGTAVAFSPTTTSTSHRASNRPPMPPSSA